MTIKMMNLYKSFGTTPILKDINLEVEQGELFALLGPSGSGKTTLLRMIAGLETTNGGEIEIKGKNVTHRSPRERKVGFVFQHYALFAHMTVSANIAYGLTVLKRSERPSKQEITKRVDELLSLVKLDGLGERYPSELSGGQRQRVALARALAINPDVLLLDEPFGALDAQVRKELRRWLRTLHKQTGITTVFVTHDQEEALDVADKVVVMRNGTIEQVGTPTYVYEEPRTPFVYEFLGNANRFSGQAKAGTLHIQGADWETASTLEEEEAIGFARPHEFSISTTYEGKADLKITITSIHPVGPIVFIEAKHEGHPEMIDIQQPKKTIVELGLQVGDTAYIRPEKIGVFHVNDYVI
ncbi:MULTISPECIES: sulfate/molybdate ABC transporter ATP-binding protein [Bacillaceae]|uniref:Carnitine transport ATP-binding protein OpuCA n=1 Tax=Alkalicoccobacillus plakortidis TaxID=444060 RepID=A0A9D5DPP4_9BACI|nr:MULTISPECIES: sulfate/molybdate ABC transporter ATP-binding protein [Bacillaceae]KQL56776.1 sulfate ABC transporter [Alkalicoccobacillus plakortidis]